MKQSNSTKQELIDKKDHEIILHTPPNHTERLKHYLKKEMNIPSKTVNNHIFIDKIEPKLFLQKLYEDKAKIWRYIDRVYPFQFKSKKYKDVKDFDFEGKTIRVVAHPRKLQKKLLGDLKEDLLNPKTFTHFLSCIKINKKYHYGFYPRELYYKKPKEQNEEKPTSRAYYKILEATQIFNLSLKNNWKVLDIGSAPGGWIEYLEDKVKSITAVDPAELDIKTPKNTIHIKNKAEDSVKELQKQAKFDLLTCDINKDPKETVSILEELTDLIKPEAHIIMTIKIIYKGKNKKKKLVKETKKALKENFKDIQIEWLPSNSKNERTIHAIKK